MMPIWKYPFLFLSIIFATSLYSSSVQFISMQEGKLLTQEGDCSKRYAPCSTFKIALSIMGYDAKVLLDENSPSWEFKEGYCNFLDRWKQTHSPALWIKNSCVWYSQILTKKLGMRSFQHYVDLFEYGNCDLSGDLDKDNGLTRAWLSSSLEISPKEQVLFLEKLLYNQLAVSKEAQNLAKRLLFVEELDGWDLYGKTGNGNLLTPDRKKQTDLQLGWFVGWIEKKSTKISFACLLVDGEKQEDFASLRAKALAKSKLQKIISNQKQDSPLLKQKSL